MWIQKGVGLIPFFVGIMAGLGGIWIGEAPPV
jgi:hypothetical protein